MKPTNYALLIAVLVFISSCGGGGSSGNSSNNDGTVQGTLLATGSIFNPSWSIAPIYRIQIDATNVYWFDIDPSGSTGNIKSVPKAGGAVTTLASGLGWSWDFVLDDTYLYWTEFNILSGAGSIKKVPKSGGAVTVLASGIPAGSIYDVFTPGGLAVDSTYVYWAESVAPGAIRRVPKAGGTVVDINRGVSAPDWVLLDSSTSPTKIYYAKGSNLYSIPLAGGTPQLLANNSSYIPSRILIGDTLYGTVITPTPPGAQYTGSLIGTSLTSGSTNVLASNLQNPHTLASDGVSLYYTGDTLDLSPPAPGAIVKIAKSGGTITKELCLVGTSNKPYTNPPYNVAYLAVDSDSIYMSGFVNPGPGGGPIGIIRVPKF